MQPGHIYRAHGAWHLRYRVKRKQVSVRLADHNDQYRTKGSVRLLAESYLQPVNAGRQVDGPMTLQQYAETVYFPSIKPPKKSPSTYKATSISTPSRFNRASAGCVCLRPRPPTCNPFCIELTTRKNCRTDRSSPSTRCCLRSSPTRGEAERFKAQTQRTV